MLCLEQHSIINKLHISIQIRFIIIHKISLQNFHRLPQMRKAPSQYSQPQISLTQSHNFSQHNHPHLHQYHKKQLHVHLPHHRNHKNIAQQFKHPRVFKLKTISLVLIALACIFLVIDLGMYLHLRNNESPLLNFSFVNDIVKSSVIVRNGQQVYNFINNVVKMEPQFYFQYSQLVAFIPGDKIDADAIRMKIFGQKWQNLLFVLQIQTQSHPQPHIISFYSPSYFKFPTNDQFNSSMSYFTIEDGSSHNEAKHSFIASFSQKNRYLSMKADIDPEYAMNCKTYMLSMSEGQSNHSYFQMFNIFSIMTSKQSLGTAAFGQQNLKQSWKCFQQTKNETQLRQKIIQIFGMRSIRETVQIKAVEIYYLASTRSQS